jgi:LDH2 family malate/lactate/ureidoglycolate dehydrogenase
MNAPNITTKRALSRRTLLKGAGVSLALPMLDAMLPCFARAVAGAAAPPHRFVGMMTNMGILPQFFFPEQTGKDYTLSPYLEFLKKQRDQLTVFSGVSLPGVDGGHAAEKSFLTGAPGIV